MIKKTLLQVMQIKWKDQNLCMSFRTVHISIFFCHATIDICLYLPKQFDDVWTLWSRVGSVKQKKKTWLGLALGKHCNLAWNEHFVKFRGHLSSINTWLKSGKRPCLWLKETSTDGCLECFSHPSQHPPSLDLCCSITLLPDSYLCSNHSYCSY